MALTLPAESHPVDSTRVDWLSVTIALHRGDYTNDLFSYVTGLGHHLDPTAAWSQPSKGRHFAFVMRHPSGIQFQYTPPENEGSPRPALSQDSKLLPTTGMASLEFSGRCLGAMDCRERMDLFLTLRHWPGFKRPTRIDVQTTLLNPEVNAEQLVREVEAGRLWAVGFGRYQAYLERNLHGEVASAATLYLGGKGSDKRYRGYDKGAEGGWDVPAVRHEFQARAEPAAAIFTRLTDRGKLEDGKGPLLMTAEERTVRDSLGTMVDFRDTSRWEGRRKPNRWAQFAPVPDWWERVLQQRPLPLEVEYRPPGDLAAAVANCREQYGRKVALEVFRRCEAQGRPLDDVLEEMFLEFASRLRRDDVQVVAAMHPELDPVVLAEHFRQLTTDAALWTEGLEPPDDTAPPS